jgi:hypothetical protein
VAVYYLAKFKSDFEEFLNSNYSLEMFMTKNILMQFLICDKIVHYLCGIVKEMVSSLTATKALWLMAPTNNNNHLSDAIFVCRYAKNKIFF